MAMSKAHSDDRLSPKVKTSNTGHAESPAKRAPMSAKKTKYIGGEQTSDGASAEKRIAASRDRDRKETGKKKSAGGAKLRNLALKPHLES